MFRTDLILAALVPAVPTATERVSGTVLFAQRARALFVADVGLARQARAIRFFFGRPAKRWLALAAAATRRVRRPGASRITLPLPANWARQWGVRTDCAAVYCGSPGALQKATIYLQAATPGQPAVVVKMALTAAADEAVAREARTLQQLSRLPSTIGSHVPVLCGHGTLDSGRAFLATTALAGEAGGSRMRPALEAFLAELAAATRRDFVWNESPARARTHALLQRALEVVGADGRQQLEEVARAMARLDQSLDAQRVPLVLAHGDLTAANVRWQGTRLAVFDWEYAQADANPLTDWLHYPIGVGASGDAPRAFASAKQKLHESIDRALPGWNPSATTLEALSTYVLIDTLLFYAVVDQGLDLNAPATRRLLHLIGVAGPHT